ncbi:MAG: PAS domain-containing protein, partial [Methylibium sp.]|nr:PAS domain-containing protein [Methylibium sp.]
MSTPTVVESDRQARIAALIETLHDTEQQLEALTAGQVDTVADQAGNTFLLRRAQEQLRQIEASKQAALLNALPANIAMLDPQGVIVAVNESWRRFAVSNGMRDLAHGVGQNYLEICSRAWDEDGSNAACAAGAGLRAVLAGERGGFSMEYPCDSPSEARRFVLTVAPLEATRLAGAVVMHLDVSDRASAEQASLRTTELLHAVADGAPDLVYVKDLQGRYLLTNRALDEFLGRPAESLLGNDIVPFLREQDLAGPLESDRRVIETGCSDTSEYTLTGAHARRTFHVTKAPYCNERGEVIGLIGISRDITDGKKAELSRENERLLLRTLIDALPDVVYTKDTSERYVIGNKAALAQFGLQHEHELAGKTAFDLMPADLAARVQADDTHVLAGQPVFHRIDHAPAADATEQWTSIVKVPLHDATGQLMGLVGFSRDVTEHKRAEHDLIEGRAVLNMVGRIAKVGGWSLDLIEQRLSWSDIVATLHDEPVGFSPLPEEGIFTFAQEHRQEVQTAIERCAALGTPYDIEAEKVTAKGRRIWVRAMGEAVRDAEGRVVRIQGAFQDITDRKLAALETQRLAMRLVNTLESMTEGFFTVDRAWRYTYVNHEAERVLHKSRHELIGKVMWDVYPEARSTAFEEGYRRAMAGDAGIRFEAMFGPRQKWIGVDCYPSDEGLSVYFRDVTDERAARQQLELMEASVAQLNDIVMITEPAPQLAHGQRIVFVNDAFIRVTGHAREDVLGRSPQLLSGPLTDREELAHIQAAVDRREPMHAELLEYHKSGRTHWIELDITPIGVKGDDCTHFVFVKRDISERRRNQDALRELNASLEGRVRHRTQELEAAREWAEQANRAKSAFLATMSHEIRTPMNGVVGMIDVLEQSQLRPSQLDMVKTVRESAYALLAIVDDVLDFSKIEAGQFAIDHEPMDVTAVVEGVCDALARVAEARGVGLRLYTDPTLPEEVLGDDARLRQVLINLLGNAIKFSGGRDHPGVVSVRALRVSGGEGPDSLALGVADNGIGMDAATLSRLFSPFTQADASTTRRFGGTGLGLSISHRLVDLMNGRIEVASEPGRGSTFTVRLPIQPLAERQADAPAVSPLAGLPCLLLGRESGPAADLGSYLKHARAAVQGVQSLPQALAWLHRAPSGRTVIVVAEPGEGVGTVLAAC